MDTKKHISLGSQNPRFSEYARLFCKKSTKSANANIINSLWPGARKILYETFSLGVKSNKTTASKRS